MARQHIRRHYTSRLQQFVEVGRGRKTRLWSAVAPAESGAIIPTHTGNPCNLRLNQDPTVARQTATAAQYDCGIDFAGAVDVNGSPTDVDRAANLRETPSVLPSSHLLVHRTRESEKQQRDQDSLREPLRSTFTRVETHRRLAA